MEEKQLSYPEDIERKEILLFALNREDSLVNNRLMWGLTIQGFLFATIALSSDAAKNENYVIIITMLGIGLSVMGAYLSILANRHINTLKSQWGELKGVVKDVSPFGSGPHRPKSITNYLGLSFQIPVFTVSAFISTSLDNQLCNVPRQ